MAKLQQTTRRVYTGRLYFDKDQIDSKQNLIDTHRAFNESVRIVLDKFRDIENGLAGKELRIILDSCLTHQKCGGQLKPLCKKERWIGNPCKDGDSAKGKPNILGKEKFYDDLAKLVNNKELDSLSESEWFHALGEMKKNGSAIPVALRGDWERFCDKTYEEIREMVAADIEGFYDKPYLNQHKLFSHAIMTSGLWAVYVIMFTHSGKMFVDREDLPCYAGYDKMVGTCLSKAIEMYHADKATALNWEYGNIEWQRTLRAWCEKNNDFMINDYPVFADWMKLNGRIKGKKKRLSRFKELNTYIESKFEDEKHRKEVIDLLFEFTYRFANNYTGFAYEDIMNIEPDRYKEYSESFSHAPKKPDVSVDSVQWLEFSGTNDKNYSNLDLDKGSIELMAKCSGTLKWQTYYFRCDPNLKEHIKRFNKIGNIRLFFGNYGSKIDYDKIYLGFFTEADCQSVPIKDIDYLYEKGVIYLKGDRNLIAAADTGLRKDATVLIVEFDKIIGINGKGISCYKDIVEAITLSSDELSFDLIDCKDGSSVNRVINVTDYERQFFRSKEKALFGVRRVLTRVVRYKVHDFKTIDLEGATIKALGHMTRKMKHKHECTGKMAKGEDYAIELQTHINNVREDRVRKIASEIIKFVRESKVRYLIVKDLMDYKPSLDERRYKNYKHIAWCKQRIVEWIEKKANFDINDKESNGIMVYKVRPENTSLICPKCGYPMIRYDIPSIGFENYGKGRSNKYFVEDARFSDVGAQVCCLNRECGYIDHVDFVSPINIAKRALGLFASVTKEDDGTYRVEDTVIKKYVNGEDGVIGGNDKLDEIKGKFENKRQELQRICDVKNGKRMVKV